MGIIIVLHFDGVSDYIDCGSNNIVTGAFTVSI